MKKHLTFLLFLFIFNLANGQNSLTPKEAYQMVIDNNMDYSMNQLLYLMQNNHSETLKVFMLADQYKPIDFSGDEWDDEFGRGYFLTINTKFTSTGEMPFETYKIFIEHAKNFNLDYVAFEGKATPLLTAIEFMNSDVMKVLLDNGANVNKRNLNGNLPLGKAIVTTNPEIVKTLLMYKPDLEALTEGVTPLLLASAICGEAEGRGIEIVKMLVNAGAETDVAGRIEGIDNSYHTPLTWCIVTEQPELLRFLLNKGADPDFMTSRGTPLYHAILKESPVYTQALLDFDADVDLCPAGEVPPIIHAVIQNEYQNAKLLLEHHADPFKEYTYQGEKVNAYYAAVSFGHDDMIELMRSYDYANYIDKAEAMMQRKTEQATTYESTQGINTRVSIQFDQGISTCGEDHEIEMINSSGYTQFYGSGKSGDLYNDDGVSGEYSFRFSFYEVECIPITDERKYHSVEFSLYIDGSYQNYSVVIYDNDISVDKW